MISLLKLGIEIVAGALVIGGVWYAFKEDYVSWDSIKDSFQVDGLKEMVVTIFSEPQFVLLYIIFVAFPVWIVTDYLHFYAIPLWQRMFLSVGGIWAVNQVMIARGLK